MDDVSGSLLRTAFHPWNQLLANGAIGEKVAGPNAGVRYKMSHSALWAVGFCTEYNEKVDSENFWVVRLQMLSRAVPTRLW